MGGAQAAGVMRIVAEDRARITGREISEAQAEAMAKGSEMLIANMERTSESMYCSSRMMDDGIIDPVDTRSMIIFSLETCKESEFRGTQGNTFGVARL